MDVLILESDEQEAERITAIVSRLGHGAYPACSEAEARRLLADQAFDLVFWDLEFDPDLGLPLIEQWKRLNSSWLLAAFIANNTREKEAVARVQGVLRFLHKPALEKDLCQILAFAESRTGRAAG